jgi:putative spermidine/putrescine transport system ATP-binding protein
VEHHDRVEEVTEQKGRFRELRIEGLTRTYGRFTALNGLDLTIAGGEFVALLGPSGCGKSTALNLLAGLLNPTAGGIWLDDKRLDTVPSEKRDFGMVFPNYALFPHLSVAENVAFGLRIRKVGKAERIERVRRALDLVQLGEQAEKQPGQLSGGQQQRVAIARAVVTEPRVVLMDEPLSNLDAKLRIDMRTEVRLLHQQLDLTTVYVTHDQAEALSLADRLVVMRDGVAQQIGSPMDVYESPANVYVAAFVGYRNAVEGQHLGNGRVRAGGLELRGEMASGSIAPGPVVVMTRPEDTLIEDSPSSPDNRIPLTVRVCEYQGRAFAVEGQMHEGGTIHAQSSRALQPGESVNAYIPPERVRIYGQAATGGMTVAEAQLVASGAGEQ